MYKVCHISTAHQRNDVRIFQKQLKSLHQAGYECVFIVADGKGNENSDGISIIDIGNYRSKRLKRIFIAAKKAKKAAITTNAQVFHIHDPELLRVFSPLIRKNKIVIYDAHEDLPRQILSKYWIPAFLRIFFSRFTEKSENKNARKINAVVAATPFIRNRFIKINSNTIDINNYPDLSTFPENTKQNSQNALCYIGGISKERGIFQLLDALNIANAKLLLAGNFIPETIGDEIKSHTGWEHVVFHGYVSKTETTEIFKNSIAGLVTLHPIINYLDSLPVKMFEYMAAGLPVIASDFPLWKQIIGEHQCGITVNPLSPDEIAKAINCILSNPAEAKKMGENGKKAVVEKFNWKNEEFKLIELYKKLLNH